MLKYSRYCDTSIQYITAVSLSKSSNYFFAVQNHLWPSTINSFIHVSCSLLFKTSYSFLYVCNCLPYYAKSFLNLYIIFKTSVNYLHFVTKFPICISLLGVIGSISSISMSNDPFKLNIIIFFPNELQSSLIVLLIFCTTSISCPTITY